MNKGKKLSLKEDIIKYIEKLFIGSIMVTSDKYDSVFHVYDKRLLREQKLNRILGSNKERYIFNYDEVKDKIVFEQDYKNNYFWIDYNKVTLVLQEKYGCNSQEIKEIINGWLKSDDKLKQLTTRRIKLLKGIELKSDDKLKQLTTITEEIWQYLGLKSDDKLKQLTT